MPSFLPVALATLALAASHARADVCRVTPDGSPTAAWPEVQTLPAALAASACTEIWLQQGHYANSAYTIARNVQVYGGFAGSETVRDQRSGDPELTRLNGNGNRRVLLLDRVGAGTVLDGFTIEQGHVSGSSGGGLLCQGSAARACSPVLRNLLLRSNSAFEGSGGALALGPGKAVIDRVRFERNRADGGYGGALAIVADTDEVAEPIFTHVVFSENTAQTVNDGGYGGAAYIGAHGGGSARPVFRDTLFSGNEAGAMGGAFHAQATLGGSTSPQFERSSFVGNRAIAYGGALHFAARDAGSGGQPLLANVTLHGNEIKYWGGGALHIEADGGASLAVRLQHVTLADNVADTSGTSTPSTTAGAIFAHGASLSLDSSIVWGNRIAGSGASPSIYAEQGSVTVRTSLLQAGDCASLACDNATQADAGQDPLLAALANNGGATSTRLPAAASPAIDKADATTCSPTDQRGIPRPQGVACDIGAVELRAAANYTLTAQVSGSGSVAVTPAPSAAAGIANCTASGGSCSATYAGDGSDPASVVASATPQPDMPYVTWSGDCTADSADPLKATVTLDGDKTCNAIFSATNPNPGPGPGPNPGNPIAVPATGPLGLALLVALITGLAVCANRYQKKSCWRFPHKP